MSLGKYKIVEQLRNIQWTSGATHDVLEYIVTDPAKQPARCLSARTIRKDTDTWQWQVRGQKIQQKIQSSATHLLTPVDRFEHTDEKGTWECLVYEDIIGPDVAYAVSMIGADDSVWPASLIRKISTQTLNILRDLKQSSGVIGLNGLALRMVYPALKGADPSKIKEFYQFDEDGFVSLNDTCTGPEDSPYDPDIFEFKLDTLPAGLHAERPCSPEAVLLGQTSPASDMFAFGALLFDIASGALFDIEATPTINITFSPKDGLVRSQSYLGELPSQYRDALSGLKSPTSIATDPIEAIYAYLHKSLDPTTDERSPTTENDRLTEPELRRLADLLVKMMDYNHEKRITPEEALKHPFFT